MKNQSDFYRHMRWCGLYVGGGGDGKVYTKRFCV